MSLSAKHKKRTLTRDVDALLSQGECCGENTAHEAPNQHGSYDEHRLAPGKGEHQHHSQGATSL